MVIRLIDSDAHITRPKQRSLDGFCLLGFFELNSYQFLTCFTKIVLKALPLKNIWALVI